MAFLLPNRLIHSRVQKNFKENWGEKILKFPILWEWEPHSHCCCIIRVALYKPFLYKKAPRQLHSNDEGWGLKREEPKHEELRKWEAVKAEGGKRDEGTILICIS